MVLVSSLRLIWLTLLISQPLAFCQASASGSAALPSAASFPELIAGTAQALGSEVVVTGIMRSADGGRHWTTMALPRELRASVLRTYLASTAPTYFLDSNKGWIKHDGLWQTDDGGRSWRRVFHNAVLAGPTFDQHGNGFIAVEKSDTYVLMQTTDMGTTWHACSAKSAVRPGDSSILLQGGLGFSLVTQTSEDQRAERQGVAVTFDTGCKWQVRWWSIDADARFSEMGFQSDRLAWLVDADGAAILLSQDGGRSFAEVRFATPRIKPVSAYFESATKAWIVGYTGDPTGSSDPDFFVTTDGGRIWRLVSRDAVGSLALPERWMLGNVYKRLWLSGARRLNRPSATR